MDVSPTESEMSADSSDIRSFTSTLAGDDEMSHPSLSILRQAQVQEQGLKTVQRQILEPYSTVGQLSYAPATQTTVVTTTTTTTTSFPPLILKAPRHLNERDPKLYPLASSPTPAAIKQFTFDLDGKPTFFSEADDPTQSLLECAKRYATLKTSQGPLQTVKHADAIFETPSRLSRSSDTSTYLAGPSRGQSPRGLNVRKRSSSPVSIAEAAEIASLQRRNKRPRTGLNAHTFDDKARMRAGSSSTEPRAEDEEASVLATPDTDQGSSSQFKVPKLRGSQKRSSSRLTSSTLRQSSQSQASGISRDQPQSSTATEQPNCLTAPEDSTRTAYIHAHPQSSILDGPGVSATPPIVETDLEPIAAFEAAGEQNARHPRPAPLVTTSLQDASLPSPSLSPITAAANLSHNAGFPGAFGLDNEDDDSNDVSSLDISNDNTEEKLTARLRTKLDIPTNVADGANPQLPTPTLLDIPVMLESFDAMPDELKTYVMYQLLRRCAKSTLHFVADVVNPALKCDFLGLLPLELSLNIVKYLDVKSMCRAAQVSKKWRHIINSDEKAWKELLEQDGHSLPEGELEKAVKEGWGWQYPHSPESAERNLAPSTSVVKPEGEASPPPSASSTSVSYETEIIPAPVNSPGSGRPKRKAASKYGTQKKQRRKGPSASKSSSTPWLRSLDAAHGPNALATAAMLAVPNPNIGLPSLRNLHLYKSLYQRHHLIRKSWMDDNARPKHIAFRAHQRHVVTCLQFDTDKIITGSDDTHINVYDTKTGAFRNSLKGHDGGVWALQYEGNILVSGSTDRSVRVWDIEKGKCLQVFQGHTSTVRCLVVLKPTVIGENADGTPIIMPKEPLIITGSRDSTLRIWRLPQQGERSVYHSGPPANDHDNPYFVRALTGHHHSVRAIAAYGDTLVSGSYDCTVRVWRISTGEVVHRLQGHSQKVYSVVLDHARNRCISGSMDYLVKVWSLETGQCLYTLEGHTSLVGLLDLSHDRLVSAAADATLRIWDPENGQCKSTLTAHTGAITCFQHDGQKVISGSDRTLKMWNVKTGECVKDLLTDLSGVWQVKFNDRRCVAAVQRNGVTYIEVLDFGASRDGVPPDQRGRRILVNTKGHEIEDVEEQEDVDAP